MVMWESVLIMLQELFISNDMRNISDTKAKQKNSQKYPFQSQIHARNLRAEMCIIHNALANILHSFWSSISGIIDDLQY